MQLVKSVVNGVKRNSKPAKIVKVVKAHPTKMDVVLITKEVLAEWETPTFQRPLTINARLLEVAEGIKSNKGHIPGTLTIGIFEGKKFRIDGQHRIKAFEISGLEEGIADVKFITFETFGEMADEFDRLNSPIARMKPDDHLRAQEQTSPALQYLRKACPFVGYGNVRRGKGSGPIIGMSVVLRAWNGSSTETPIACSVSAQNLGRSLTLEDAMACAEFLNVVMAAWGRDPEYARLWTALNLTLCAWMYRQIVMQKAKIKVTPASANSPATIGTTKITMLTKEEFTRCMMSLSAKSDYLMWLVGRNMNERDRAPCYERIKRLVQSRLQSTEMRGKRAFLPSPGWVTNPQVRGR